MIAATSAAQGVFVHIVTYNSMRFIERTLAALLMQEGFTIGEDLLIRLTDNDSRDGTVQFLAKLPAWLQERGLSGAAARGVSIEYLRSNTGFSGGNNHGCFEFLRNSNANFFLCLNHDLVLAPTALAELRAGLTQTSPVARVGMATPKLLRADDDLRPVEPRRIDAAGMHLTASLRHFDRGSNELDGGRFAEGRLVFGGTGACLFITRSCAEDLLLEGPRHERDSEVIYPQLATGRGRRVPLFDEGFFAYREDADLAWRAQLLGWRCLYVPEAIGFHRRRVLPENRAALPAELNTLGVRNRFLLQINNLLPPIPLKVWLAGIWWRNFVVIAGVLLRERSSLPAFGQFLKLFSRAFERRRILARRARVRTQSHWFRDQDLAGISDPFAASSDAPTFGSNHAL